VSPAQSAHVETSKPALSAGSQGVLTMSKSRLVLAAAAALAAVLGTGAAQAHDDVQWSVTIGSPVGVPVYTQPAPVYQVPAPQYRVVTPGYPVYGYHQPTRWDRDGDGIPNWRDPHPNRPEWQEARRDWRGDRDGRWDRDHDGRHDRDGWGWRGH
jgi:hypothetical protein